MPQNRASACQVDRVQWHNTHQTLALPFCEKIMEFINPLTDYAFKKIFGSAESHDILLSFLNAVLGLQAPWRLREVRIQDPYLAPTIFGMKESFVDVRAIDEQGRHFIIEMQVLPVIGFEQRVLYNSCKKYAGQISRGEDYRLLNDVIALTITDFTMFEHTSMVSKFKLRDENGREYSDDLELIFVELPKFTKNEADLTNMLDKWCYFLRYAKRLNNIPSILAQEAPIEHAFTIANRAQLSPQELNAQENREIYIQDQRGMVEKGRMDGLELGLELGKAEGKAIGKAEGKAIGMAEGKAEGKHEQSLIIARNLHAIGLDKAQIAAATGLSLASLQQIFD
jgi:predicted transposase/invertase (TIGR01784 family)